MSLERSRGSVYRFGRATVTIVGPARFVARPDERWLLASIDIPDRDQVSVVATFAVEPQGDEDAPVTIEIALDGDPARLVVVGRVGGAVRACRMEPAAAGRAAVSLDVWRGDGVIRVFELASPEAAEACLVWFMPREAEMPEGSWAETASAEPQMEFEIEPQMELESVPQVDLEGAPPMDVEAGGRRASTSRSRAAPRARDVAAEEAAPRAAVPVHAMAEMPRTVRVDEHVDVRFTLSWQRVAPAQGAVADVAELDVDPDAPLTISISMRGFRLARGARRVRTVHLRPDRAAEVRVFKLEAVDLGPGEVTIVVRQHHETPLATLRLTSEIVRDAPTGDRAPAEALVTAPEPRVVALPTLRIDESRAGGETSLDVAVQIGAASVTGSMRRIDKARVVADAYDRIKTLSARLKREPDAAERKREGLDGLRSIGVDLARKVLTRDVRRFLWQHLDDLDHLFIQTTGEFDIPWELLYVSDPDDTVESKDVVVDQFLGMRGATRWVYNTAWTEHVTVGRGRANYLCPSYRDRRLTLTFTQGEGSFVRSVFKARVVRPGNAASLTKIITDGFDLLHFAGHGVWTDAPPDQRLLLARYRRSTPPPEGSSYAASDLRRDLPDAAMVDRSKRAPMVFLNACDVGRLDTSEPGLGGFPEAFLRGGVGVLLGCCWAVDDGVAGHFVRDFYEALTTADLHDALGAARRSSLDHDDLSGLAYVAYAHPYATVTIA